MELHSGELFWDMTIENPKYLNIGEDLECDVLVIGGGMSGALISNSLIKTGLDVVVVDKRTPGYGSSDGNTGIIQYNSDKSLDIMIEDFGEKWAVDFYKFSLLAMEELDKIVKSLGVDVGYKEKNSLLLCSREEDLDFVYKNYITLKKYGFPAEWIDEKSLKEKYKLMGASAIKTWKDAELNPFRMVQELHRNNLNLGGRVFKNSEVKRVVEKEVGFHVIVNDYFIKCKHLIYATGYV